MKKITCIALLLVSIYAHAGSCIANGNGNWESGGTWSCGHAPGAADNVTIGAGITVTVNANNTTAIGNLGISGTLLFTNGAKINLASASVVSIYSGGSITGGNGGAKLVFPSASYSGPFSDPGPYYFSNGGFGAGLLPSILASFSLSEQNQEIILFWKTENEDNINSFSIESSNNGSSGWQSLGVIPPMALNAGGFSYSFADQNKLNGDRYYHLKIIDRDGKFVYSKVLFIAGTKTGSISIFPTLASGTINVNLPGQGLAQVSIFNVSGQLVKTLAAGTATLSVDVSGLGHGAYFLKVSQASNFYTAKFIKQ